MDKPPCFSTVRFYENWRAMLLKCSHTEQKSVRGHCRDCLPTYQLRMKKAGRCIHPETMFTVDQDGSVVGVLA